MTGRGIRTDWAGIRGRVAFVAAGVTGAVAAASFAFAMVVIAWGF